MMLSSSSSPEAGQVVAKTTMFNQTCDRLRKYIHEKRSLEENTLPRTMNLFPIEKENSVINSNSEEDSYEHIPKNMMTIFYNGQVIVVDNVSNDKANDIISTAMNLSMSSSTLQNNSVACGQLPQAIARDMSQTRSRSLTRFFEKRKERINGKAPYDTLKDKSWLGLSAN